MTQRQIPELVNALTRDHPGWTGTQVGTAPALLERLREAVVSSTGRTSSGRTDPSQRAALNLAAFATWEDITGRIAAMFNTATDYRPTNDPTVDLTDWYAVWDIAERRGHIDDTQRETHRRRLAAITDRIDTLLNPPQVGEIIGHCPECGERYWFTDPQFGDRTSALYSIIRPNQPLLVRCHSCETEWHEDELAHLAHTLRTRDTNYGPPTGNTAP